MHIFLRCLICDGDLEIFVVFRWTQFPPRLFCYAAMSSDCRTASASSVFLLPSPSGQMEGPCTTESCSEHCKSRKRATGQCDKEQCVCKDAKQKGRCATCGLAALAGMLVNNNNNNNNIVVMRP